MNRRDIALLARAELRRRADELRYGQTRQGRFEESIRPDLVHPDGTPREISDGGRAVRRMIRALDWAYHSARREAAIRRLAARLRDGTLRRILWGVFRGRDQAEAIRLAGVSRRTFYRGVAKILRTAGCGVASRRNTKAGGAAKSAYAD